jgi:arylsulfatase A-like enzyme
MKKIFKISLVIFSLVVLVMTGVLLYYKEKRLEKKREDSYNINILENGGNGNIIKNIEKKKEKNNTQQSNNFDQINKVILVTIDTLRADHLGYMGYPYNTSPFLDKLAEKSIVFKKAYTVIPTTASAEASIFTSLYPINHRSTNNYEILDDSFLTMAEIFKENGYKTAAFVSVKHILWNNLDQGFDIFNIPQKEKIYRNADETIGLAVNWLDEQLMDDKFFLWIHLYDPHFPYNIPDKDLSILTEDSSSREGFFVFLTENQNISTNIFKDNKKDNLIDAISEYDKEILFLDYQLKNFYNYVEERNFNKNTFWTITSEHGEGLGGHDFYEHVGRLYEEQLLTPIIFHFPSSIFIEPSTIDRMVENIDILPTFNDILGFSMEKQKGTIQGISLLPLILNKASYENDGRVFSWTGKIRGGQREGSPAVKYTDQASWTGEKFAIQNNEFKYIYNLKNDIKDEFYNIKKDPLEKNNLIDFNAKEKDQLREILFQKINQLIEDSSTKNQYVDEKFYNDLESLGYFK